VTRLADCREPYLLDRELRRRAAAHAAVPPDVGVGGIAVRYLSWPSDPALTAVEAASDLAYAVQEW
jgi:hypothetical protein